MLVLSSWRLGSLLLIRKYDCKFVTLTLGRLPLGYFVSCDLVGWSESVRTPERGEAPGVSYSDDFVGLGMG